MNSAQLKRAEYLLVLWSEASLWLCPVTLLPKEFEIRGLGILCDTLALGANDGYFTGIVDYLRDGVGDVSGVRFTYFGGFREFFQYTTSWACVENDIAHSAVLLFWSSDKRYVDLESADQVFGDNVLFTSDDGRVQGLSIKRHPDIDFSQMQLHPNVRFVEATRISPLRV